MAKVLTKTESEKADVLVNRVVSNSSVRTKNDILAIEEPLEIRLGFSENGKFQHKAISITMRTPGNDFELAAGFLFTEGIISSKNQIAEIKHCGKFNQPTNTVRIDLHPEIKINLKKLERHFYTTSSCGVCGKSSIEALSTGASAIPKTNLTSVSAEIIHKMPETLRKYQKVFDETGGLHASALFDYEGNLLEIREDVGRHNAVDKLIGGQFLKKKIPLDDKILFLSGRASFELVQKAVMAQIPIIAAVSAPSSLAVETAKEFDITLLGFVRNEKYNIYSGNKRIVYED